MDPIEQERDEALAFARSEARRNAELQSRVSRMESREKRDYDALKRIRDGLLASGFYTGSYLGLTDPVTRERFGDYKYDPALEIIEQYIGHLQGRLAPVEAKQ